MRVLLDTHTLLWALLDPAALSDPARQVLDDATNEILVSSVSAFEIATKHRIGKLPEATALLAAYSSHLEEFRASELALRAEHGLVAGRLEWDHRDPFDRALAAQSMIEGIPLMTRDPAFATLPGIHTIW